MICGKTIVIDEIEKAIKDKFNFTKEDDFNILLNGTRDNKSCVVTLQNKKPICFTNDKWEKVFADLRKWINE